MTPSNFGSTDMADKIIESTFKYRRANEKKLLYYGFAPQNGGYAYSAAIADGQMQLTVFTDLNEVTTRVIDVESGEPYSLFLVDSASGAFIGKVKGDYEQILCDIAEKCFDREVFKGALSAPVIRYVAQKYGDEQEFLWQKLPDAAVWRRKDNRKWYGLIMNIEKRKLGLDGDDSVDALNLRTDPAQIDALVDGKRYFYGYHMNKRSWITVTLDGALSLNEICRLIDISYILAAKK